MYVPIYLLLSVTPGISCMTSNVIRHQGTQKNARANVTKNVLFWVPNTRYSRLSSDATSRQAGTLSELQNTHISPDRNKPVISDTQEAKHQDGANIHAATAALLPAGGVSATQIPDLAALDLSQNEPFLTLTKREHTTQMKENKAIASSVLSSLFFNSRIDLNFDAMDKGRSSRPCLCENLICDCSGRLLTSVPQNLPVNITTLLLDRNHLQSLPKNAFSRYKHLEVLDLSVNHITVAEQGTFVGLNHLTWLDFSRNSIGKNGLPPEDLFEPLRSLKFLRFDLNKFPCDKNSALYGRLFSRLHRLEKLQIDSQSEQYYGKGFKSLKVLHTLKVHGASCYLDTIYNSTFENLQQLQILNISDCNIEGANIEYGAFSFFTNLRTLDISRNRHLGLEHLQRVMYGLRNSSLETLIANTIADKYSLNFVNTSTIQYLPQTLTTLVATGNNIVYIDHQVMKGLPKSLKTIDISDNDITMDPMTLPLADIQELQTLVINNINEECPTSGEKTFSQSLQDRIEFLMQTKRTKIKTHVSDASENTIILPFKLKRVEMSVKEMNYQYLESINENNIVKELDLSCSYLPIVEMGSFVHLPELSYLNLRSSFVRLIIPPDSSLTSLRTLVLGSNYIDYSSYQMGSNFKGLPNLIDLDLSDNDMAALTEELFGGIDKLEYLRLNRNLFSDFIANISHLQHLKLLNLSKTGLPCLPEHVRTHINQLSTARPGEIRVDMSGCPIQCDCFNLEFLKWMTSSPAFDSNFGGYKCRYPDTSVNYIADRYEEILHQLTRECAHNYPMFLVILAGTLMLFCLVVGMVIYRFRWDIRYLYYAAYLKVTENNKKDNNHPFKWDVFPIYDSEDSGFVEERLIKELQHRSLELLVHKKDFVAGRLTVSNIVMAVAKSRKTLVVLTRNLLQSKWCKYEIRMAATEAAHTGRPVLVFLLKEDIPSRELNWELHRHIKNNTYLTYPCQKDEGDEEIMKLFYDKLAHDLKL
ncbi:hypothetical protein BsWGS_03841 [Bradybaena similaris]